jgi:hypothetical protein
MMKMRKKFYNELQATFVVCSELETKWIILAQKKNKGKEKCGKVNRSRTKVLSRDGKDLFIRKRFRRISPQTQIRFSIRSLTSSNVSFTFATSFHNPLSHTRFSV